MAAAPAPAAPPDREEPSEHEDSERHEEEQASERKSVNARVVHKALLKEGEGELERTWHALGFSGLAAGASMGLSLVLQGGLKHYVRTSAGSGSSPASGIPPDSSPSRSAGSSSTPGRR